MGFYPHPKPRPGITVLRPVAHREGRLSRCLGVKHHSQFAPGRFPDRLAVRKSDDAGIDAISDRGEPGCSLFECQAAQILAEHADAWHHALRISELHAEHSEPQDAQAHDDAKQHGAEQGQRTEAAAPPFYRPLLSRVGDHRIPLTLAVPGVGRRRTSQGSGSTGHAHVAPRGRSTQPECAADSMHASRISCTCTPSRKPGAKAKGAGARSAST